MSLGEALDILADSEVVRRGLPGEMYRLFDEYKRDEYARFMATVTEWDNDTYMELPAVGRYLRPGGGSARHRNFCEQGAHLNVWNCGINIQGQEL